jgi:hypothetical protein
MREIGDFSRRTGLKTNQRPHFGHRPKSEGPKGELRIPNVSGVDIRAYLNL